MARRRPSARGSGLASRLLAAIVVVLLTAVATAALVAAAVGPGVFHDHMVAAGAADTDAAVLHAERAFRDAGAVVLALALGAAAVASSVVSVVLTRRIARSLRAVAAAAGGVGAGRYEARVPRTGLGEEFDALAASFNTMAARLQDAERLRGRLLADVAHELRTPVATLAGYLEAVEDGVRPLDPATVAVLRDQATRLTRLAQDLAAVTRAEAGDLVLDLEPVDAGELCRTACAAAQERAEAAGVRLRTEVLADGALIRVDRTSLAQVLDNLVDNALRHTPRGGVVVVATTRDPDGNVRLSVADTGEGIGPEHLPHVFERFYRADSARDRAHGGSGIGLAISRALVEAHGGAITAESDGRGSGATFVVVLPGA
ncbi:sensor histidine kinase [Cellulomonas sp. APG4]|uniref:sensor histidine kinase n=1 Tax=Cellulomonas sp. APG4 TaxID=1538656 RepID=UPI00351B441A